MRITKLFYAVAILSGAASAPALGQARPRVAITQNSDVRELPADQQILQALNRLTFGPRPGEALKVRAVGLDNWIDQQLHPEKNDDSQMDQFAQHYSLLNTDQNDLLRQYVDEQRMRREAKRSAGDTMMTAEDSAALRQQRQMATSRRQVITQLQSSRVARAVASERQLQEVMTDFWENHFNIYAAKGAPEPYYLVDFDQNVIRPNALGKFRDLLEAVAKSPAMLFYLDNARSMADSTRPTLAGRNRFVARQRAGLNENYGRELMELHTLGVDGGYTQQDVINVARAFTGWTIKPPVQGGGFIFRPQLHDAGEKIVLGRKLAAGRGIEDAEDVLDILARSPATARFISYKLARRFVSDSPSTALVNRATRVYLKTDGDIREVVRTIITSPEFFSQQAFRAKVKSPFEVVVSAMRAVNATPDSTPRTAQVIAFLGEPVFGHEAPNGWPETGESWMNTGAILSRINFGLAAAAGRIPGVDLNRLPAFDSVINAPREKQVDVVVATVLDGMVSPDTRAVLLSGEHPLLTSSTSPGINNIAVVDSSDSDAPMMDAAVGTQPVRKVGGGGGKGRVLQGRGIGSVPALSGLSQIVGLALGSPEFQRH